MYDSFSSLPPSEESAFVVFEQRMRETSRSAMVVGMGVAGAIALVTLIVVLAFWGPITPPGGHPEEEAPAETTK